MILLETTNSNPDHLLATKCKKHQIEHDVFRVLEVARNDVLDRVVEETCKYTQEKPKEISDKIKFNLLYELEPSTLRHLALVAGNLRDELCARDEHMMSLTKRAYGCPFAYDKDMDRGHFYIINPGEAMHLELLLETVHLENILHDYFKIGKTKCLLKRIQAYPPNSVLLLALECPDRLDAFERAMMRELSQTPFKPRTGTVNSGREYYNGKASEAVKIAFRLHREFYES